VHNFKFCSKNIAFVRQPVFCENIIVQNDFQKTLRACN